MPTTAESLPLLIYFFLYTLNLYLVKCRQHHGKDELVQRIYKYFDEINKDPVVYHWKYRLEEIDPSEDVAVDTLQIKKSS